MYYQYEMSGLLDIHMIGHSICRKGWGIRGRTLTDWELVAVYKGSLAYECGDRSYIVEEGRACLLPRGVLTSVYTPEGGTCRFYYVHFGNIADFHELTREELDGSLRLHQNQIDGMQVDLHLVPAVHADPLFICEKIELSQHRERVFTLFESALNERNRSGQNNILMISLTISQILIWISRAAAEESGAVLGKNTVDKTVQEALVFIRENYNQDISIRELSGNLGVSQQYFMRLFKQTTGTSPVKFINRLRLQNAKDMLRDLSLNISEIGFRVGYGNVFYFSRVFRQYEGMTPTEYRKWLNSKSNE